ncbi:venom serine protease inhibitor-like [Vanessa atalanta]|uniref:venom serine protease inhibitor-like n=1 Tax=Vanessa atalanta TaxID=42275 RepID=UPI001FCDC71F|nr:venom serine protease inhibitor-like [Vanessa atalanta]
MTNVFVFATVLLVSFVVAVPTDEETPLSCPENEKYYKCSLEVCYKKCEHLKSPPPCPSISSDCFLPSCECKNDYLRNSDGVCVPYLEC